MHVDECEEKAARRDVTKWACYACWRDNPDEYAEIIAREFRHGLRIGVNKGTTGMPVGLFSMFLEIKSKIEKELTDYIRSIDRLYSLSEISPVLLSNIREFLCRKGKRVRPTLFVIGYLGFAKKIAPGLYRSAVSLELLHDFMLVHDDIIDKSATRRGKPSMHEMLNKYLARHKNLKFNGQDLTIVAGDVMYAMALHAFLAIKEDRQRKEAALRKLIEAVLYTGSGEFIELLNAAINIDRVTREDIYKIYDLKTANYTFASPLSIGATLAGAEKKEADRLFKYGIYLGRAFQIKDDAIGMFSDESEIGKPNLTDIREGKKTLLIWQAYRNSDKKDRAVICNIFSKRKAGTNDLLKIRRVIVKSGALDDTKREIAQLIRRAQNIIRDSKMIPRYKNSLNIYIKEILG